MRKHLSYANVMATLAVVIAVAGGSTAIAITAAILNDPGPPDGNFVGATASAACPAGSRVLSGGGASPANRTQLFLSAPQGEGWAVSASGDGVTNAPVTVVAKCLSKKVEKPTP